MNRGPRRSERGLLAGLAVAVAIAAGLSTLGLAAVTGGARHDGFGRFATTTCSRPKLEGHVIDVQLSDAGSGMMGPGPMMATLSVDASSVPAGRVSLVAHDRGALAHEVVVLPLSSDGPGTRPTGSDGKVNESASLGEASRSCAQGAGDGLSPGSTGWTTLTLKPGRYELICDEPWHYASGMFDVLTVR